MPINVQDQKHEFVCSQQIETFKHVIVNPTEEILRNPPGGAFFRGGPIWPYWPFQIKARQCRGPIPFPKDVRPRYAGMPSEIHDAGVWCGPLCWHYGHTIADFGMRIAASVEVFRSSRIPLVFSAWTDATIEPPPYFWDILEHLNVDRERVLLIRAPTKFRALHVLPQAERMNGGSPSSVHLSHMDRVAGDAKAHRKDLPFIYVSRAGQLNGRIAGETYLDNALTAVGVRVFHPEFSPLSAQIAMYKRGQSLIFAEGSAVHSLQLMGRLGADVSILSRRPLSRIARSSLKPRAKRLRYLNAIDGIVYGLQRSGRPYRASAITVLGEEKILQTFTSIGIDLSRSWDRDAFRAQRDLDIREWLEHTQDRNLHPDAMKTAARCLSRLNIEL